MTKEGSSRRDRKRSETATRIEIATRELCLEHGIESVSVDAVARAVGISRRTIYRYFLSIDDILLASSRRSLVRISRDVRARPPQESVREAFASAFAAKEISGEEAALQRLDRQLAKRHGPAWLRLASQMEVITLDVFTGVIAERLPAPRYDRLALLTAKVVLTLIVHFFPLDSSDAGSSEDTDIDKALGEVLRALEAPANRPARVHVDTV